jgi:hypothetical protein
MTSAVRARTSPARARIVMRSACACTLRCFTGYSNSGSILASRARVCASSRSSFLRLSPISRTLRAFATTTSCPNSLSRRLIQGECVPIPARFDCAAWHRRLLAMLWHWSSLAAPVVSGRIHPARSTSCCDLPDPVRWSSLPRNIPAWLCGRSANLLHCRSPFISCASEHVDNLGAYTASRPETGLLSHLLTPLMLPSLLDERQKWCYHPQPKSDSGAVH